MRTKIGILYCLKNVISWNNFKKCGRTSQLINKRLCNLQTSLLDNCEIIYTTEILQDIYFYEFLMKKLLKPYRVRLDREFFDVDDSEIQMVYDTFNYINKIYNTPDKLNEYIKNNYPEYLNKKRIYQTENSSDEKPKRKKALYVDTSY
jgi:hypothetical protein